MDFDKLRQWFEMAQKFQGSNFWSGVFDQQYAKQFMNEFSETGTDGVQSLFPRVDLIRGAQEIIVLIDLPGVSKEDVQLSAAGEFLYIKGTARFPYPDLQIVASERFAGSFERAIKLPEPTNGGKITAKYENGMLEVHIAMKQRPQTSISID
jgi:HSP20 family protein